MIYCMRNIHINLCVRYMWCMCIVHSHLQGEREREPHLKINANFQSYTFPLHLHTFLLLLFCRFWCRSTGVHEGMSERARSHSVVVKEGGWKRVSKTAREERMEGKKQDDDDEEEEDKDLFAIRRKKFHKYTRVGERDSVRMDGMTAKEMVKCEEQCNASCEKWWWHIASLKISMNISSTCC